MVTIKLYLIIRDIYLTLELLSLFEICLYIPFEAGRFEFWAFNRYVIVVFTHVALKLQVLVHTTIYGFFDDQYFFLYRALSIIQAYISFRVSLFSDISKCIIC
jgi:hypothetical protein